MDVLFEGRLSHEIQIKNVFQRILNLKTRGLTVLRIASTAPELDGKVLITDGAFVTGARLMLTNETGYNALRKIATVAEGNFAYMAAAKGDHSDLDKNLNLIVERIIPLLPTLPDQAIGLFDEKSLLDKVFGSAAMEPIAPQAVRTEEEQEREERGDHGDVATDINSETGTQENWRLLQPLSDGTPMPADDEFGEFGDFEPEKEKAPDPIDERELESLLAAQQAPKPPKHAHPVKGSVQSSASSPLIVVMFLGALLLAQVGAIYYWKPLHQYLLANYPTVAHAIESHQTGGGARSASMMHRHR